MPALTVSGNEVTDAVRAADALLGITASGNMCDGRPIPGGFGIRRAATNLFRRGQCDAVGAGDPTAASWGSAIGGEVISVDATTVTPFSPQSIKYVTNSASAFQGCQVSTATGLAAAAGTFGAGSIYFKGVAGQSYLAKTFWRNTDATVTLGNTLTFNATGAWQLLSLDSVAVAAGKTGDRLEVNLQINGTRSETFWAAHAMIEKGQTVVAPYVATSGGATATHAAAAVTAPASLGNVTQMWFAARARMGFASTDSPSGASATRFCSLGRANGDTDGRLLLAWSPAGAGFNVYRSAPADATGGRPFTNVAFGKGDLVTVAGYATATALAVSVNGGAFVTAVNSKIPNAPTVFQIGGETGFGGALEGDMLWFACGPGTLTNADAALLAALGDHDPSFAALPSAAQIAAVWPADTSTYEIPLALAAAPVLS